MKKTAVLCPEEEADQAKELLRNSLLVIQLLRASCLFVRDKNKQETDFLILKERKPWLMVEAKYSDAPIESHHIAVSNILGGIPVVQVCFENNVASQEKKNAFRVSASRFLL